MSWADRPGEGAEGDDDAGNRKVGGRSQAVLDYVVQGIVDDPDGVHIDVDDEDAPAEVTFRLHVAPSDMGRVIGRRGRTAQAIRRVVRAAGHTEGVTATVDIVD